MPGIFGCLVADPKRRIRADSVDAILDRMEDKLRHQDDYTTDRWIDTDERAAIGRIGHAGQFVDPLMIRSGDGAIAEARCYGHLSRLPGDGVISPDSAIDPMLAIADESGGFSAICLSDSRSRMALVVDRRASEPLYTLEHDGIIYFAPEIKALLALGIDPGGIDPGAMAGFLSTGNLFPHQTMFKRIRKIPSCHALLVGGGKTILHEYWRYVPGHAPSDQTPRELVEKLGELVYRSVQESADKPSETICFLSGGLDSRYLLACLARIHEGSGHRMNAVTWGERTGEPGSDPVIAEQVAAAIGNIEHKFLKRESGRYGDWFREVNYLVDGLSEISVFHPHEYQIMKQLRAAGFTRVIRGDEAFGLWGRRYSPESALTTIGFRPLRGLPHLPELVEPAWYREMCETNDTEFAALLDRFEGLDPTTLKDVIYFSQRVPTYLSQAAYYKQVLFEHRSPLLSNELLDFYQGIGNDLRRNKVLFFDTFARAFPDLARIPYATDSATEDWGTILAGDTELHRFMKQELHDEGSGIWELFNRERAVELFEGIGQSGGDRKPNPLVKTVRGIARKAADTFFPARVDALMSRRSRKRLPVSALLLRLLVLKDWHDRFHAP